MRGTLVFLDSTSAIVGDSGKPVILYGVTGIDSDGAGNVSFYNGTSSGDALIATIVPHSVAGANVYPIDKVWPGGVVLPKGCYVDITGATDVSVHYEVLSNA